MTRPFPRGAYNFQLIGVNPRNSGVQIKICFMASTKLAKYRMCQQRLLLQDITVPDHLIFCLAEHVMVNGDTEVAYVPLVKLTPTNSNMDYWTYDGKYVSSLH